MSLAASVAESHCELRTVKGDRGNGENVRNVQKQHLWLGLSVFPSDRELRHNWLWPSPTRRLAPGWASCWFSRGFRGRRKRDGPRQRVAAEMNNKTSPQGDESWLWEAGGWGSCPGAATLQRVSVEGGKGHRAIRDREGCVG